MAEAHATIDRKHGINPIWFVPVVALAIGIGMVIYTLQSQGPEITITLSTAEGIEAGKTKIKLREVDIGLVDSVVLGEDRESVVVTCSLDKSAKDLLREDTQFWVVRPRIGAGGVSGLGTLLSGGYIQLAPGEGAAGTRDFVGLEEPPVTPTGTPGAKIILTAKKAGAIGPGDPVLFRGYTIGRVETETFDAEKQLMSYSVFIDAPYNELLTTTHRFWDVSGITVEAGADGIRASSVALETLLIGGVEVGLPDGVSPGTPAMSGEVYKLYENYTSVNRRPYRHSLEYVVRFAQSVRGLSPGAPVEYRGLRLGEVQRVMLDELAKGLTGDGEAIPVLIRLEPGRIEQPDSPAGVETMKKAIANAVGNGLRASLSTGNLLTGSLYVSMDYVPNVEDAELGSYAGRPSIPTVASGIEGIAQKLTMFLDKLNELPLEDTVIEAKNTLASLDRLVASDGVQELPASLDETLTELQSTLRSMSGDSELQARLLPTITELERTLASLRQVLDTLDEQPNALIFNRKYREDLRPPTGSQ
jgi:paraquat-inducible protein B